MEGVDTPEEIQAIQYDPNNDSAYRTKHYIYYNIEIMFFWVWFNIPFLFIIPLL